jgi:hypothetical protein
VPRLLRDNDGPVLAEAWEAQAFALAVELSEQGYFTVQEWAATLADELRGLRPVRRRVASGDRQAVVPPNRRFVSD